MFDHSRFRELRKTHRFKEAFEYVADEYRKNNADFIVQNDYGWGLFDKVKALVQEMKKGDGKGAHLLQEFYSWLRQYARLDLVDKPGLLHSMILAQVVRVHKDFPKFLEFVKWWDPANFREEDLEPNLINGKRYECLELKCLRAVSSSVAKNKSTSRDTREWAIHLVDRGMEKYQKDTWLGYYRGIQLISEGDPERARVFLVSVAREKIMDGWAWANLGRTYENDDPEKAVICLYHAVSLYRSPPMSLGARFELAKILSEKGRYGEAAFQVRKMVDIREKEQYKIPEELEELRQSHWFRESQDVGDLPGIADLEKQALQVLYEGSLQPLARKVGILDNHNPSKKLAFLALEPRKGVVLKYNRFPAIKRARPGSSWEVSLDDQEHPVRVDSAREEVIEGFFEEFEGELDIAEGRNFGFVHSRGGTRIFVPGLLLKELVPMDISARFVVKALKTIDRKKGVPGWKALEIRQKESS